MDKLSPYQQDTLLGGLVNAACVAAFPIASPLIVLKAFTLGATCSYTQKWLLDYNDSTIKKIVNNLFDGSVYVEKFLIIVATAYVFFNIASLSAAAGLSIALVDGVSIMMPLALNNILTNFFITWPAILATTIATELIGLKKSITPNNPSDKSETTVQATNLAHSRLVQ